MDQGNRRSREIRLQVQGERACFTRPEMKVERVSYDLMTPSAARGILEAILWRPAMRWIVTGIDVLKPIRWDSIRRNEVKDKVSADLVMTAMKRGRGALGLYVDRGDQRQQRAGLCLRDVAYTVHAAIELTAGADHEDTPVKYREMFLRRAGKGQCFHRPYLGCREFAADFLPIREDEPAPAPITENRDLGWMFFDYDYRATPPAPRFFRARLDNGRLAVPDPEAGEVRS